MTAMTLDYRWILDLIPLRFPNVLVDRVVSLRPDEEIEAEKAVSGGDLCYQGLADGLPGERYAFPRSLVVESFGQSAALLWLASALGTGACQDIDWIPMAARIRKCRFHGDAYPGDVLRHRITLTAVVDGDTAFLSGQTRVDDRVVFSAGSLVAVRRPVDYVRTTAAAPAERST